MYPIDWKTCTAIEIIQRSMTCHPSTLADQLRKRISDDYDFAAKRFGQVRDAARASANHATIALGIVESGDSADLFKGKAFMGPGIIALHLACRLQLIPDYVRTRAAVDQWGD